MAAVRNLRFVLTGVDKSASKAIDGVAKRGGALGKTMKFAATGVIGGLAGIAAAAIKTEADFSSKMNQMGAVADVPASGLANLSKLAMKMGADTVFSAGEAADAMLELAKGGLTAAQIEAGALASTLSLAAAGGLELGAAATYMSNAMNTFGLQAKDAESIAAALAGGANASTASVESMGMALSQVGPGAKTAGLSLQETVAVLAAFDNAGIKGSDAGTSLKTMLTRLVPQTDKAATAMQQIGLETTNADGSFKSITDIAEQLRKGLTKLSDKQRTYALNAIFGSDATRAATVLMGEGAKGVQKYIKQTSDLNAAQRVAASRMSGTAGAIEQMKGSLETASLLIGQELAPHVVTLSGHITDLANGFVEGTGPGGEIRDTLADLRDVAAGLWPEVQAVAGHTKDFVGFLADHPEAVKSFAAGVAAYAVAMKAAAVATASMAAINLTKLAFGIGATGAASGGAAPKVTALGAAARFAAGPIGLLAAGLVALEEAGVDLELGGKGTYDKVWDAIQNKDGSAVWDALWGEGLMVGDGPKPMPKSFPAVAFPGSTPTAAVVPRVGGSALDNPARMPGPAMPFRDQRPLSVTSNLHLDGQRVASSTNSINRAQARNGATPAYVP